MALPDEVVRNAPIAARLGVDEDWIVSRTGVRERRVARARSETLTGLAARAGRGRSSAAGVEPLDVDLVLVATLTQDDLLPNAAPLVAERAGRQRRRRDRPRLGLHRLLSRAWPWRAARWRPAAPTPCS